MTDNKESIYIRPIAKRNGLTVTLISSLLLIIAVVVISLLPQVTAVMGYFLVTACLIGIVVGVFKIKEPEHSFVLSDSTMLYQHTRGTIEIDWDNVQRIDTVRIQQGIDQIELPYIGISLKQIKPVLDNISLRLASHIISDQRSLQMTAIKEDFAAGECKDGSCPSEALFDVSEVVLDGKRYVGLLAMFANRMKNMRRNLGFELYIPITALDRDPEQFVSFLRQLKANVNS